MQLSNSSLKLTDSDKYALNQLKSVIGLTQQNVINQAQQQDPVTEHEVFRYNQYRVIKINTIEDLAGESMELNEKASEKMSDPKSKSTSEYYDMHFTPCNRVRDDEASNMGVNKL